MIIAAASTDFADHVHVGKEIHFDTALPLTLARFAASSGNVEGEASGLVAALTGFGQHAARRFGRMLVSVWSTTELVE